MKSIDNEEEIMILYEWVDSIPLTRVKKSINRDFSDGVLMAEIIKTLYPKMVDLNNYPEVHSVKQKAYNWNTLNEKVLKKLDLKISQKLIQEVASSQQGAIEQVLKKVYLKAKKDECTLQKIDQLNIQILKEKKDKIDYKEICYKKEMEINKLKEKLKKIQKEISTKQQENNELKEDIANFQRRLEIEEKKN